MTAFPGGTAVSDLQVYDWEAADGCRGGSPHLHTASSEGYVVVGGTGAVQTLTTAGFSEYPLAVGDVLWFTPGTVHRLVNTGDLRLFVVMSNAGLPEAGDAVLTFPDAVLADPVAYAAAAALPAGADADALAAAARRRRDLAVEGFEALRAAAEAGRAEVFDAFLAQAAALVAPKVEPWRGIWQASVVDEVERTRAQLDALAAGEPGAMTAASVTRADPTPGDRRFGMCGRLQTRRGGEGEETDSGIALS